MLHRVVMSSKGDLEQQFFMAYFVNINGDAIVETLDSCKDDKNGHETTKYASILAWDHLMAKLDGVPVLDGHVAVICAGTSDLPTADEAAVTLELFGNRVERFTDVGVAGIHRLLAVREQLESANVVIVIAGMEGALPSAVAGLVSKPVIAVPTSVGYGASFAGVAALLGMLNSCGSGVTVVNIDNGFGAAYAAAQINRLAQPRSS